MILQLEISVVYVAVVFRQHGIPGQRRLKLIVSDQYRFPVQLVLAELLDESTFELKFVDTI